MIQAYLLSFPANNEFPHDISFFAIVWPLILATTWI